MAIALSIAGQRYRRLLAIARRGTSVHGKALWFFQCDCGNHVLTTASDVKAGKTSSCGCLANEARAHNSKSNSGKVSLALTRHGCCYTSEYNIWKSIKQRTRVVLITHPTEVAASRSVNRGFYLKTLSMTWGCVRQASTASIGSITTLDMHQTTADG